LRFFISLLILSTVLLTVEANCEDKVLMLIPKRNFRDEELFVPKEIIENSGYKIELVSSSKGSCFGLLGHKVEAAKSLDEVNILDYKAVVFIGGIGAKEYWHDKDAISLAKDAFKDGIILAAICIAPVTLANAGVLEGKRATVSDAFKDKIIMSYGFSRKLALELVKSKVKAYIGIGAPNKKANSSSHHQKTYKEGYVHSVNVTHEDAIKLIKKRVNILKLKLNNR